MSKHYREFSQHSVSRRPSIRPHTSLSSSPAVLTAPAVLAAPAVPAASAVPAAPVRKRKRTPEEQQQTVPHFEPANNSATLTTSTVPSSQSSTFCEQNSFPTIENHPNGYHGIPNTKRFPARVILPPWLSDNSARNLSVPFANTDSVTSTCSSGTF